MALHFPEVASGKVFDGRGVAADGNCPCANREGLDDIRASPDTPGDNDLDALVDHLLGLRQCEKAECSASAEIAYREIAA